MEPIIFHIDVNSAFLSWSALAQLEENPSAVDLRLIPSIVGGDMQSRHGVVLAKSIPAKKYGIVTGEPIVNAMRKCPNLTLVSPTMGAYSKRSHLLMQFLSDICPDIEQASIDECYMDYTPIASQYASPEDAAFLIKEQVRERFKFTVNIGISNRKVLAKMASDFKKPDLIHTLYTHEIATKMWPLPVSSLFMCGKSSVETLHKLGISTIGELAASDPSIINAHLKKHGMILWEYANGIDDSRVYTQSTDAKGIGNSTTLSSDYTTKEAIYPVLLKLAESVSARLRDSGQAATMVSTEIKYNTFRCVSHQTVLKAPTAITQQIYQVACQLFDEIWDGTPVRLLGVRTSKLVSKDEPVQMSLFDYVNTATASTAAPTTQKLQKLDETLDDIRHKYGKDAIVRGSFLDSPSPKSSK